MSSTTQSHRTARPTQPRAASQKLNLKELDMMTAHKADVERFNAQQNLDANDKAVRRNVLEAIAAHRRAFAILQTVTDKIELEGMSPLLKAQDAAAMDAEQRAAIDFLAALAESSRDSADEILAREYLRETRGQHFTIDQTWEMPKEWIFAVRDHYRNKGMRDGRTEMNGTEQLSTLIEEHRSMATAPEVKELDDARWVEKGAYTAVLRYIPRTRAELAMKVQYIEEQVGSFAAWVQTFDSDDDYEAIICTWDVFGYPSPVTLDDAIEFYEAADEAYRAFEFANDKRRPRFEFMSWTYRECEFAFEALLKFPVRSLPDLQKKAGLIARDKDFQERVFNGELENSLFATQFMMSLIKPEDGALLRKYWPEVAA